MGKWKERDDRVELVAAVHRSPDEPLGVMLKAIIATPNETERRIVNATKRVTEGEEIAAEKQEEFITTDKISQKGY